MTDEKRWRLLGPYWSPAPMSDEEFLEYMCDFDNDEPIDEYTFGLLKGGLFAATNEMMSDKWFNASERAVLGFLDGYFTGNGKKTEDIKRLMKKNYIRNSDCPPFFGAHHS